jgi:GDSL-like lipase/acylhydrolase family protein
MRSRLIPLALVLGSLVLCVGLAEAALHLIRYREVGGIHLEKLMEYDPVLGWRHRPNASSELTSDEYHTVMKYNTQGLRGRDRTYRKPVNTLRIVVLGDSFADGYTVQVEDRFTEVLESNLGPHYEVINLGVAGYSTDQELLLLGQEGWKWEPDLVVLAFYFNDVWGNGSWHISHSTNTQKPVFVLDGGGKLALRNVPVPRPVPPLRDRFKLYGLIRNAIQAGRTPQTVPARQVGSPEELSVFQEVETSEHAREWAITRALLRKMNQETQKRGHSFVVFYVPARTELSPDEWSRAGFPTGYHPRQVAKQLAGICAKEGIALLDPSARFQATIKYRRLYYAHDAHWNATGHHLAGDILTEYVRAFGNEGTTTWASRTTVMFTQHHVRSSIAKRPDPSSMNMNLTTTAPQL